MLSATGDEQTSLLHLPGEVLALICTALAPPPEDPTDVDLPCYRQEELLQLRLVCKQLRALVTPRITRLRTIDSPPPNSIWAAWPAATRLLAKSSADVLLVCVQDTASSVRGAQGHRVTALQWARAWASGYSSHRQPACCCRPGAARAPPQDHLKAIIQVPGVVLAAQQPSLGIRPDTCPPGATASSALAGHPSDRPDAGGAARVPGIPAAAVPHSTGPLATSGTATAGSSNQALRAPPGWHAHAC